MNTIIELKADLTGHGDWLVWVDGFKNVWIDANESPYGFPINVGSARAGSNLSNVVSEVYFNWLRILDDSNQLQDGDPFTINITADHPWVQANLEKALPTLQQAFSTSIKAGE